MMKRHIPNFLCHMRRLNSTNQSLHNPVNTFKLYVPSITNVLQVRNASTKRETILPSEQKDSWLSRKMMNTRQRLGLPPKPIPYYRLRGLVLSERVEAVDWREFFRIFQMPNTFHSWFLVIELHMWMLNVRATAEGKEGDLLRKFSMEYMWESAMKRAKKLESYTPSAIREGFEDLHEELMAAFLAYDHGLLTSDIGLAEALWFRFLEQNCDDPERVELLVKHVRKQIKLLDLLSKEEFVDRANITWLPLSEKLLS